MEDVAAVGGAVAAAINKGLDKTITFDIISIKTFILEIFICNEEKE